MKKNKKIIMALYLLVSIVTMSFFTGCSSSEGSIDGSSIVISKSIDESGNPIDIIENISTEGTIPTISKSNEDIYVSIKVTSKKLSEVKVIFNEGNNQENKIANTVLNVTESGYINYYIANIKNLKESKYSFAFANSDNVTEARCSFNLK